MNARPALLGGGLALAFAAGAALGVLGERAVLRRSLRRDVDAEEPFGSLRSAVVPCVAADGTRLHVEVEQPVGAPDDGLSLVFCHGYALSQDAWHYQRRDLRSLGRLVFWDQRSHGRSGRGGTGNHLIDTLGEDLLGVIEAAAPTGPVVLVGHSMGGMTIMALAAAHPELFGGRVRGVGLVATSSGRMDEVPFGLPVPVARVLHRLAPGAAGVLTRQSDLVELARGRTNDLGELLTHLYSFGGPVSPRVNEFVAGMNAATPVDVLVDFLPSLTSHDKADALDALHDVETLVVVGTRDLLTPEEHSHEIVRRVPGAELVVLEGAGHMVELERYAEVNQALRELVGRVRRNLAGGDPP